MFSLSSIVCLSCFLLLFLSVAFLLEVFLGHFIISGCVLVVKSREILVVLNITVKSVI